MIVANKYLTIQQMMKTAFFFLFLPCNHNNNNIVSGTMRAETPINKFARCTSRTLRSDDGGSTYYSAVNVNVDANSTDSDNGLLGSDLGSLDSHPYCLDGYYCDLIEKVDHNGGDSILGLCRPCFGSSAYCLDGRSMISENSTSSSIEDAFEIASVGECQAQCGVEKNVCSSAGECPNGLFCAHESDGAGYCHGCPSHPIFCSDVKIGGLNLTSEGLDTCISNCDLQCRVAGALTITDSSTDVTAEIAAVNGFSNSIQVSATGHIVDCGLGLDPCLGAEGAVCFIERGKAPFINKTRNCEAGGGIAAVIYNVEKNCDNIDGTFFDEEVFIPAVALTHLDGINILEQASLTDTPMIATVDVGGPGVYPGRCVLGCMEGNECNGTNLTCDWENGSYGDCEAMESRQVCNDEAAFLIDHLPCLNEKEFCDLSLGKRGYCTTCPDSPLECFYSGLDGLGAKECVARCDDGKNETELENNNCKVCPKLDFTLDDLSEGFTSTKEEIENPCNFCALKNASAESTCSSLNRWDMIYPERNIRLFGNDGSQKIECWAIAEFYRSLNIEADNRYCESARQFNYVCGCSDSIGYVGANTELKMKALVWMPRVGAILSILGSIGMIISVMGDKDKRKKIIGELIIGLSCFDIIGSIGYAFTSLPIPEEDYIYGAKGNTASCKAQGFFIQIGTISLYINVSIAFYYMLIIQFSWREYRLRKSKVYHLLYAVPISVGAIFAFAAIPYYNNAILWCNNSQKYWSEIPVAVAIAIATYLMLSLCWFVYKSEKASARYSARANSASEPRASLSKQFFHQSMVYLAAFYLTWPAYLALQVMIANGNAFSNYGFYLFAGTAVTLQGFWNFVFHSGLQLKQVKTRVSSALGFSSRRAEQNLSDGTSNQRASSRHTGRSDYSRASGDTAAPSKNSSIVSDQ